VTWALGYRAIAISSRDYQDWESCFSLSWDLLLGQIYL